MDKGEFKGGKFRPVPAMVTGPGRRVGVPRRAAARAVMVGPVPGRNQLGAVPTVIEGLAPFPLFIKRGPWPANIAGERGVGFSAGLPQPGVNPLASRLKPMASRVVERNQVEKFALTTALTTVEPPRPCAVEEDSLGPRGGSKGEARGGVHRVQARRGGRERDPFFMRIMLGCHARDVILSAQSHVGLAAGDLLEQSRTANKGKLPRVNDERGIW